MRSVYRKIIALLVIAGMNCLAFSAPGKAYAMFSDIENSNNNAFQSGVLSLALSSYEAAAIISPAGAFDKSAVLMNAGTIPMQYHLRAEKISGNDALCGEISVVAKRNGIKVYDGMLPSLSTAATSAIGTWKFSFSLSPDLPGVAHGDVCKEDIVWSGWQSNVGTFGSGGFTDVKRLHVSIGARMIVLNEFLPNPEGAEYGFDFGQDGDSMPRGEWVELYNMSDFDQNVSGWSIKTASGNTIPVTSDRTDTQNTIVPAHGWLVVYMNAPVMSNDADTVTLTDNGDQAVDSYSYSGSDLCAKQPTPGGTNDENASGTCAGVPGNKSYARIPDGIGDFVDPIPTPGHHNEEGTPVPPVSTPSFVAVSTTVIDLTPDAASSSSTPTTFFVPITDTVSTTTAIMAKQEDMPAITPAEELPQ